MQYERYKQGYHDEPIVCYCGRDVNLKPGARFGPVIRDIFIVECCEKGAGSVIVNGKEFFFSGKTCFVLQPGDIVVHTTDTVEPRQGIWCAIDGFSLKSIFKQCGIDSESPFVMPAAFDDIHGEIEKLIQMRHENDPGADLRRAGCIYNILGAMLRTSSISNKNMWVQKAIGIMEARYHENINVEDVAKETGLDRTYFSTLFREQTGQTPYNYLTALRIKKASTLLKTTNVSVSEVACSVGIDSQNFSRVFKKETGMKPSEFKNSK